jgi:hypothetical protein
MAEKTKRKRISRRSMMGLLGSGVVIGVMRTPEEVAAAACDKKADVSRLKGGTHGGDALICATCCKITKKVIDEGFDKLTKSEQAHIRPVKDTVAQSNLLEYVFMLWGVDDDQVKALTEQVTSQLKLTPYSREK